jgi:hypothetical protein
MAENSNLDAFATKYGLSSSKPAAPTAQSIQKPEDPTKAFGKFLADRTSNSALSLQDGNEYGRVNTFDNSVTGAFKDRYKAYGQDTYNRIGFDPYINNELNFTSKTNTYDDLKRWVTASALPMIGLGFMSPLNSYKDVATGNTFKGDTDMAKDYEYYNALGYSSRGGVGGFGVNLLNSFSYSAGILIEGAIEGALIGAAVGAVAGEGIGAIPGAAIGGLVEGISALTKIPRALFQTAKTIGNIGKTVKGLTAVNSAKNVWNAARTGAVSVGKILNPLENTTEAVMNLSKWKDIDNMTGLARSAKTAGAFWHDMMSMNMALSEGKLEGGFSELRRYEKLYNEHYAKFGEAPDEETQRKMVQNAREAGITNTMWNTGLVFYSNKIALPSLTRAKFLKGLPRLNAGKVVGAVGKEFQLVVNNADDIAKATMEKVPISFKNSLKALKSPRKLGAVGLNYFKANLVEGLQEVGQDALSEAVENYYDKIYKEPSVRSNRMFASALVDGIGKQSVFSETFLSGFAMGTLFQGPSTLVKHGTRLGNRIFKSKDSYDQYVKEKSEDADRIVNAFNNMTGENAKYLFDPSINSLANLSLLAKRVDNPDDATTKEIKDDGAAVFALSMLSSIKNGTFDMYMDHIKNYKNATPEEIEEAWELEKGEGQKALDNLDQAINNAKTIKNRYEFAGKRFKPALVKEKFKPGTEEYLKAELYEQAYKESLTSFVFLQDSVDNTIQRLDKLYNTAAKLDPIAASPFSNFAVLTNNANKLDREIEMLKADIEIGSQSTEPTTREEVDQKRKLLKNLFKFQEAQNKVTMSLALAKEAGEKSEDFFSALKEEGQDIHAEYSQAFLNVLNTIAGSTENQLKLQDQIEKNGGFEQLYDALFDTHLLKDDRNILSDYINLLAEPEEFYEHVNRNFKFMKNLYDNRKEYIKDVVNQEFEIAENNEVLTELATQGIFVDLDKFADWVENKKNIPDEFIDTTNNMIINKSSVLYPKYAAIFARAASASLRKAAGDPATEKQKLDNRLEEINNKKKEEINKLRENYEQQFLQEIGRELDTVEQENSRINQDNAQLEKDKEDAQKDIDLLTKALETLGGKDVVKINKAIDDLLDNNIISQEEYESLTALDANDPEAVNEFKGILGVIYDKNLPNEENYRAAGLIMVMPDFIANEINNKKEILATAPAEPTDIESTTAYKVYTEAVEQVNARYEKLIQEVKEAFAEKGIDENTVDPISVNTPYDEMPEELQAQIDAEFDKFLAESGDDASLKTVNPNAYEMQRENWIALNGRELISNYNQKVADEARARAEKLKEPPFLKYSKKQVTSEDTVFALNQLYKQLKRLFDTGKDADGKDVKLSAQQKADLKEDLENLAGYLDAIAKSYKPKSLAQNTVDKIVERVINRRGEVEDVVDAEGRKTRKFAGEETATDIETKKADIERRRQEELSTFDPMKDSTFAKLIKKETSLRSSYALTPGKRLKDELEAAEKATIQRGEELGAEINARYDAELAALGETAEAPTKLRRVSEIASKIAKEKTNFDWAYNKKELILNKFKEILENETDTNKAVSTFMALFTRLSKTGATKQFDSKRKLDAIEKALNETPTLEKLSTLIDNYAFIESTDAGTKVDELIRKFLTLDSESGFLEISYDGVIDINDTEYKVSDFMSKKAFDRLFGPGGIVSSIRSKMIDGEFVLFPENLLVFDKTLGITGEIDLLGVNAKGEVMIIDIKTSKNWDNYEKENNYQQLSHRAQLSIYATLFYNMTGIKPKELKILPLQISVDVEGYVNDIDKAKVTILDKDGNPIKEANGKTNKKRLLAPGYYDLEFLDEIADEGVIMIEPTFTDAISEDDVEEQGTEETPPTEEVLEETEELDGLTLNDLVNKQVIFNGTSGKLIVLDDGSYAVEKSNTKDTALYVQLLAELERDLKEETNPEIRDLIQKSIDDTKANIEESKKDKVIEVVYHKLKPATNGSLTPSELGISVITGITFPFQVNNINGRAIKAEFTNNSETTAKINGVDYNVIRDNSGAIVALSYRKNQALINEIDEELSYARTELTRLSKQPYQVFMLNQLADLNARIDKLTKEQEELLANNDLVFVKGGNSNDYIFALNSLPNSFQKATKALKPADEKKDLKEIDRLSLSAAVSKAITEILDTEEYPETLDILFDVGVQGITLSELDYIYDWIDKKVDELYALSSTVINRGDIIDDISNQINALLQLKNDLNLIKIIKDGKTKKPRFSKQQAAANKIFGTKEVQKRTSVPKNEKPTSRQTKTVSGQPAGEISTDELKDIVKAAKSVKPNFSSTKTKTETEENQDLFSEINSAKSKEDLETAYINTLNKRGDVSATTVTEVYNKRKEELNKVSFDTLKKGTLLYAKNPIFDGVENAVVEVTMLNPSSKQVVVKLFGTETKKAFSEQEIKDNFIMYNKEAMEKSNVVEPVTETQKAKSTISKSSIKDLGTNPELLNKAKEDAKKDSKSRFSALKAASDKNNINNCD